LKCLSFALNYGISSKRRQLNDNDTGPIPFLARSNTFVANYRLLWVFVGKYFTILLLIFRQCESQFANAVL